MDTSETYIKMCEKAEEIQHGHKWEYGDWFIAEFTHWIIGDASFVYEPDKEGLYHRLDKPGAILTQTEKYIDGYLGEKLIWLPRQDQLQEMLFNIGNIFSPVNAIASMNDFIYYENKRVKYRGLPFTSMEQLWLAFVMKEKYNKVWEGESWVEGLV